MRSDVRLLGFQHQIANDVTYSQVSSAEHTAGILLEMFSFLGVCIFGPRFYYNTFLVSNRMIG